MLQGESRPLLATLPLVAIGSNEQHDFGGAREIVKAAPDALEKAGLRVCARSELFETPCFPVGFGPDFVNSVVILDTDKSPVEILQVLHRVEADFRRVREKRWGPRTLDLDLIAVGEAILPDIKTQRHWMELPPEAQLRATPGQLILPHPRLQERAFVLIPMARLAAGWRHPVTGKSVKQMLDALPEAEKAEIRPIGPG